MTLLPPGAWRLVLKRAAHDRLVVVAALVTILLAATLLASGPIYAEAVALSGLRRTLEDAPVREATLAVSGQLAAADRRGADERVTGALEEVFGPDGVAVHRSGLSGSFALPALEGVPEDGLAVLGYYDDLPGHAMLVAGTWPAGSSGGGFQAALSEPAAQALGLEPGDALELASVRDADEQMSVRVSGIYRMNDVADPFWWESPLELEGRERISFTTFGPFVVSEEAFFALAAERAELRWRAAPRIDDVGVDELDRLRRELQSLEEGLNASREDVGHLTVRTGLGEVLARADRALLVSRAGVLVPSVQLAVLAGAALLFLAGLLAERRRVEAAILRARGATPGGVGLLALAEAALLAVPAVAAAPWLAALSLRALNHVGPLAGIGLELEPRVGLVPYVLAALAGALCVAGLALPALRSAAVAAAVQEQGRSSRAGIVQRAGLDVVLVLLAVLAYWQLRRYETPVVESIRGRVGIDPLLVAAPALGLLAGAFLALRVVPALGSGVERIAARARGVVPSLGARQVSRRPARYARAAVLLTLALAIGLFASAYGSTWLRSQEDRAAYEAGADLRVLPDQRTGAIPALHLAGAYGSVDGVEAVLPALERPLQLSGAPEPAGLLAVDVTRAADVIRIRPDLAGRPLQDLMSPLAERRLRLAAVELPGDARTITLSARVSLERLPSDFTRFGLRTRAVPPTVSLVLLGADGLLHRVLAGELPLDGRPARLVVDLEESLADGRAGRPAYPLSLVAVELNAVAGQTSQRGTLVVDRISSGATALRPDASTRWSVAADALEGAFSAPRVLGVRPGDEGLLAFDFATGARAFRGPPVTFSARPGRTAAPESIPALVTDRFLELTGTRIGGTVALGPAGSGLDLAGSVRSFPTLPPQAGGAVVDAPTYAAALYLRTGEVVRPSAWFVDAAAGRERAVARALRTSPFSSAGVIDRAGLAERLTHDPVAVGITGALSVGFVAAAGFAILGFAVSSAVSAAERTTEFAVLRSLGLSGRQLTGWLALEGGLTAVLALAGGLALGAAVALLVLPFVSLAGEGGRPFPEVIVELPWDAVALLAGGLAAVPARAGVPRSLRT